MRWMSMSTSRWLLAVSLCGFSFLRAPAQDCPARPSSGTVVADPLNISSVNGALNAKFTLGHSVDISGYTHFCYKYQTSGQIVESPTLRLNPGDVLNLDVVDGIKSNGPVTRMNMAGPTGPPCGDSGAATINSTNVHFH